MPLIASKVAAEKLISFLDHQLELTQLFGWAEEAMMEGDFERENDKTIRDILFQFTLSQYTCSHALHDCH